VPLPGGANPTGSNLPANWRTQPTTQASFDATVAVVQQTYGYANAQQFQSWYAAAWARDRQLTPDQAFTTWVTQQALGPGIQETGTLVGAQVPEAAAAAAGNVANQFPKAPSVANPLDWLSNIGRFFSALGSANLWLRVAKVAVGGVMLVAGLMKLSHADQAAYGVAGKLATKLPGV
jgi:hypothetical protein